MKIKRLPLLIAVALNLLGTQQANAEQPNIAPAWANNQVPIAWADCIPVPIMPSPIPNGNTMGIPPFPSGFMPPVPYMNQGRGFPTPPPAAPNQPMRLLPPPSPFFNPAGLPIPLTAPAPNQVACNNSDSLQLKKLQAHYKRAAAASKTRMGELQQALDDMQHQMADSREIIEGLEATLSSQPSSSDQLEFKVLQGTYQEQSNTNIALKKQLAEIEMAKQTLINELGTAKESSKLQSEKLSALSQTASALQTKHQHLNITNYELKQEISEKQTGIDQVASTFNTLEVEHQHQNITNYELKQEISEKQSDIDQIASTFNTLEIEYQHQNISIYELQQKLAKTEIARASFEKELISIKEISTAQADNLTSLAQTASAYKVLQANYQRQNISSYELKQKLAGTKDAAKNLQIQIEKLNEEAGVQTKKLEVLSQTSTKLKVLQEAYQQRTDEIEALKKNLTDSKNIQKNLQEQLSSFEKDVNNQAQKLSALGQTATEFKVLQESYQVQTYEVVQLKKNLVELDTEKKVLQLKLDGLKDARSNLNDQLTNLQKTDSEFKILQEDFKLRVDEITKFKKSLAESDETKKSLQEKLGGLEETSNKLKVLQESYKLRTAEITELEKLLSESDNTKKTLQANLANLEEGLGFQSQKLTALEQESNEFKILQESYKLRVSEIAEFESLLAESDSSQNALQTNLKSFKESSSAQALKLSALGQTASEFKILQGTYQSQNYEITELKKNLVELDTEKKALLLKLNGLKESKVDLNNQLTTLQKTDSELQNSYELQNKENSELNQKLSNIETENKSLQIKLSSLESDSATQAEKLTALEKSTSELSELQKAYQERLNEITELKNKLAKLEMTSDDLSALQATHKSSIDENTTLKTTQTEMDNAYKALQAKLGSLESNATSQAEKLAALGKSTADLSELQKAYKAKLNEISELEAKLADMDSKYKTLQSKLVNIESNAAAQATKITALGKSTKDLGELQKAHKAKLDEIANLKTKLAGMDSKHKTLQSKFVSVESNAAAQATKLVALGKSTTELGQLQKNHKAKLEEIANLKVKLAGMDNKHKILQSKLVSVESNAAVQATKLTALGKSTTELASLKTAYKARNNENANIKKKMAEQLKSSSNDAKSYKLDLSKLKQTLTKSDDSNKSLLAKITTFEKSSADQASQITSLMTTGDELKSLQIAYNDLKAKLAAATADGDKDGVLDTKDKCPNTTSGIEVDNLGCFADSDKDGVANSTDQCPASPEGSTVNGAGCPPLKDADKDGIADKSDLCPSTKTGETVNNFGCSPAQNITLKGVNFATGSATLTGNSLPILDRAAAILVNNPTIKVEIAGHTDDKGLAVINKRLSQRRANSVMIYLIKKGADATKLSAKGYGESQPIAKNNTEEGRATNRRVEMKTK